MKMNKSLVIVFGLLALAASQVANAATITYQLTSDHCTGLCGPQASFGSVELLDVAGGVQMTVTLNNGNLFVNTGFDATIGFNLIGDPTITENPDTPNWSLVNSNKGSLTNFDGFKTFEYGILCGLCGSGGSNPQSSPLVFTILGTGLDATDFAELSSGKGGTAAFFAVDIISGTTGKTGLVDASGTPTVPDGGSTVTLLGSVLLGLGMLRGRFRKN